MILCFLITGISFIFFLKSRALKPFPPWASEMRLLPLCFWKDLSFFPIHKLTNYTLLTYYLSHLFSYKMSLKKKPITTCIKVEKEVGEEENDREQVSVLDLPDLVLESILERLPPESLCKMACVCSFLKERCTSDHLWKRHMRQKWGRLIGQATRRNWGHIASSHHPDEDLGSNNLFANRSKQKGLTKLLSFGLSFSWIRSKVDGEDDNYDDSMKERTSMALDSIMARYLALENGKLRFPAQVYNRENGHVGFMLSCYDAEVCYDPRTDTFQARYPPHGSRAMAIENGVEWERLRAPPISTCPHDLHVSDCLDELQPGDPIEIQWKRNKDFPYGWWYGVVGHLESCDGNANHCHCHKSDRVVLEFNQYAVGSRWRHATINREEHGEEGNEADGFYGGIRKLHSQQEISTWNRLWPLKSWNE